MLGRITIYIKYNFSMHGCGGWGWRGRLTPDAEALVGLHRQEQFHPLRLAQRLCEATSLSA